MQMIRRSNHFEKRRLERLSVKTESAHWLLHDDGQNNKIKVPTWPLSIPRVIFCAKMKIEILGGSRPKKHENSVSFSIFTPKVTFEFLRQNRSCGHEIETFWNIVEKKRAILKTSKNSSLAKKKSIDTSRRPLEKSVVVINRPRIPFTLWMVVLINASWVNFS